MSANVNTTTNGTQSLGCLSNSTAKKIGTTFAYCLILAVSLAGNIFIGIIVYKTKSMRKPINFLIVNMAMSDLLFPIFLIPQLITDGVVRRLLANQWSSWPCLMYAGSLLNQCLAYCVCSEPGSDSIGSIWSCGISSPFPTHQFKAVPLYHFSHLDRLDLYLLPISFRLQTYWMSRKAGVCAAVEGSLWRALISWKLLVSSICCILVHPVSTDSHTLHYNLYKA